ncbi:MAG: dihydrofolate reductase, partial [Clostridia bacterium]|nr:dihydrofolate reductase [Clostridia bacterium]
MDIIVAVAKDWGIGKDNYLLFHIPEDMKYFRKP